MHQSLKSKNSSLRLVEPKHTCGVCDIKKLLSKAGTGDHLPQEGCNIRCRGPYLPGDRIYTIGDPFRAVYAITSGSVKTELTTVEGSLKVTDFYLRGELFAAEALGESHHVNDAVAMEKTWLCELPIDVLESLCQNHPQVLRELFQLLGRRYRNTHLNLVRAPGRIGEQRVFEFLQEIAERSQRRHHLPSDEIPLPMNKSDIASYLGLTPETLSRILRRLNDTKAIHSGTKSFRILSDSQFDQQNSA